MTTMKSESTVRPVEWDLTSSPNVVYHNYNISETEATEDRPKMFTYDVDVYSMSEYQNYMNANNASSITDVQVALAEVYEMVLGGML